MRYGITYYYKKVSESDTYPFWAKTEVGEFEYVATCGESWEDVRSRHIKRLSDKLIAPEPPLPESIEL